MTTRTDDFNRADGALGSNWTADIGSGCTILSNEVRANTSATSHGSHWSADSFGADQYSQVAVTSALDSGTTNAYVTVFVRLTGSGGTRNCYQFTVHSNVYYVSKVTNGSGVDLSTASGTFGDLDVIKIEATGTTTTTLRVYKNGVQVGGDVTDSSSPHTSGAPGFECYNGSSSAFATWDDWEGGDIGGGGGGGGSSDGIQTYLKPLRQRAMRPRLTAPGRGR